MFQSYCDKMTSLPTSILSTENSIKNQVKSRGTDVSQQRFLAAVAAGEPKGEWEHRPVLRSPSVSDSRTLFMAPM